MIGEHHGMDMDMMVSVASYHHMTPPLPPPSLPHHNPDAHRAGAGALDPEELRALQRFYDQLCALVEAQRMSDPISLMVVQKVRCGVQWMDLSGAVDGAVDGPLRCSVGAVDGPLRCSGWCSLPHGGA